MSSLRTITIALSAAFLSCAVSPANGPGAPPSDPTPFDHAVFSGYYLHTGSTVINRFVGAIGSNGVVSELAVEEEGALVPGGAVGAGGGVDVNGTIQGLSHTYSMRLTGSFTMAADKVHFTGNGNWTGSLSTSTSGSQSAGTWTIDFGKPAGNNAAGAPQYLCWTGTYDSLREFKLLRMNGANGAVSVVGGQDFFCQLVYGPDSTLYGVGSDLSIIDPSTGGAIKTIPYRQADTTVYMLMTGAEFSPEGVLYVREISANGRVFTVDTSSGDLTYIATPSQSIGDIAFAPQGTLYSASSSVLVMDPSSFTVRNFIGSCRAGGGSLFFNAAGEMITNDEYPSTEVRRIDVLTGATTVLFQTGTRGIVCMVEERIRPAAAPKTLVRGATEPRRKSVEELKRLEAQYRAEGAVPLYGTASR